MASPTYTEYVNQNLVIEPLIGPKALSEYTQRFPDEIYHKAPESHLIRLLQTLMGPAGIGWLRKQIFEARLALEAQGLDGFDLDAFYGNPFAFGRVTEEFWDEDPSGLLPQEQWEIIRIKDERYRSRAIDFMNGARAGNTPFGMKLVARSGLGHEVEIIEQYKYLFDIHSDDPLGLTNYGKTNFLNEMVVLPRQETPLSEQQSITITGNPTGGSFALSFNGQSTGPIAYNYTVATDARPVPRTVDRFDIQEALWAIPSIGNGGVEVTGGGNSFTVRFRGHLGSQDNPQLTAFTSFTGGSSPDIIIDTITDGIAPLDEVVHIPARDRHALQSAVDRIKSVTTIPTVGEAPGLRKRQAWNSVTASSEHNQVVRYVTGQPAVQWPAPDTINWIERNKEKEAPRIAHDMQYHYQGFHTPSVLTASSSHVGRFGAPQRKLIGFDYLSENTDDDLTFTPDRALADYPEPLVITTAAAGKQFINGVYPSDYLSYPGVPSVKYTDEQFWASKEAASGSETLEIDLGSVCAVNFIAMEVSCKPIEIEIEFDGLDQEGDREWEAVTRVGPFPASIDYAPEELNPWFYGEYSFSDALGQIPLTRYIRITFERLVNDFQPFLINPVTLDQDPWSIEVRNLRIGRNVSNF